MSKTNWFSEQELLDHWQIKEFELLERLTEGLQPYSRLGDPIPPPNNLEKLKRLKNLKSSLESLVALEQRTDRRPAVMARIKIEREKNKGQIKTIKEKISKLEKELSDIDIYSWKNYRFSNADEKTKLLEVIKDYLFSKDDVINFERNQFEENGQDRELINLMDNARPEIEEIYSSILAVGFSGNLLYDEEDLEKEWKEAALNRYQQNMQRFKYIKRPYLEDSKLYAFSGGQERRDFVGRILKKIMQENKLGRHGAQRLYIMYSQLTD